jgi:hypothetical protein
MGKGYQVVLDDLQDMASTMSTESAALAGLRPRMAPNPVSGGDAAVDAGISAVLSLFASLNAAISGAMADHSKKVQETHDGYQEDDSDVALLFNDMIEKA